VKAEWVDQDGLRHQFCIIKFLNLSESNFSGGEGSGFRKEAVSTIIAAGCRSHRKKFNFIGSRQRKSAAVDAA
jgi:hypothetical protein